MPRVAPSVRRPFSGGVTAADTCWYALVHYHYSALVEWVSRPNSLKICPDTKRAAPDSRRGVTKTIIRTRGYPVPNGSHFSSSSERVRHAHKQPAGGEEDVVDLLHSKLREPVATLDA